MATSAAFSSLRRRRSPPLEAFLAPVDLTDGGIIRTVLSVANELVDLHSGKKLPFQRQNFNSLVRKLEVFVVVLDFLKDFRSFSRFSYTAIMCFKELYLLFYRCKILLDYCSQSSKLWMLLQNQSISGHFHDLNQEMSTLLDVLPIKELSLSEDVREQVELLQRQLRRAKCFMDKNDEMLRHRLYSFLYEIEKGQIPDSNELWFFFVDKLGIRDPKSCRAEIEFLEEQIVNHEGDVEPTAAVLNGFVALTRYCRFLLFGFEEEMEVGAERHKKLRKGMMTQEIADTFLTIPKDFCCPISLDLMQDPVIVSTGQTYDRSSISRWLDEGHYTCPKTGQMLANKRLIPNRALRNLITQWSVAHGIPYEQPEGAEFSSELAAASSSKAAVTANQATAYLLIQQLASGSEDAQTIAAREIRLLSKTGKENRAFIAEAGAVPHLKRLLLSANAIAQENSVTAMLNLSIHDKNKGRIMDEEGCLNSIVDVLRFGQTTEARENAAATLFSLSAVHNYKKRIADESGAVEALAYLLRDGTPRGKKDAVTALFNLSTHTENCVRMIEAGAVSAVVGAIGVEGVSEEAAGALALIVRHPAGAEAVGREEKAVAGLLGLMRCGTPRGKENAVAALLELCRSGGAVATEKVLKAPTLAGLLQTLLFTGTKRARRKAASLARVFQRRENAALHSGGVGVGYPIAGNSTTNRDTSFVGDVSVPMSISVPVVQG
ncbi:U-box domain-containing protein 17-like [Chenopodium quinoa]|uniref:RING-type E3 ubiquitin transferase n=1 Tax=Chenopodium quinoa TaxID=63459 RepID=A0A803N2T2_CHEQI|nr:U-box domain-containing protein 17-like [Chenopodium quinoa]